VQRDDDDQQQDTGSGGFSPAPGGYSYDPNQGGASEGPPLAAGSSSSASPAPCDPATQSCPPGTSGTYSSDPGQGGSSQAPGYSYDPNQGGASEGPAFTPAPSTPIAPPVVPCDPRIESCPEPNQSVPGKDGGQERRTGEDNPPSIRATTPEEIEEGENQKQHKEDCEFCERQSEPLRWFCLKSHGCPVGPLWEEPAPGFE
jgi:hypothetical protein